MTRGRYVPLGTDGYGMSDTREKLRRHFEVDAESVVIAALDALRLDGKLPAREMTAAIRKVLWESPREFDPRKYLGTARGRVKELVRHKVRDVLCCAGHAFD